MCLPAHDLGYLGPVALNQTNPPGTLRDHQQITSVMLNIFCPLSKTLHLHQPPYPHPPPSHLFLTDHINLDGIPAKIK